jgi:hypothetical protein
VITLCESFPIKFRCTQKVCVYKNRHLCGTSVAPVGNTEIGSLPARDHPHATLPPLKWARLNLCSACVSASILDYLVTCVR